ncbi:hypothetical protein A9R10_08180 [Aeromonas piscicola]|nr:hypothetical protein A9R10_08180 [Aeromonas piscicola]
MKCFGFLRQKKSTSRGAFFLLNSSCSFFSAFFGATDFRAIVLKFVFFQFLSCCHYMAEGLTQAAVDILCAELTFYGAMLSMCHVMLSFALA